MPAGKQKSRSKRRVYVRTIGGENKVHYREKKPKKKKCSQCGKELQGIPHKIKSKFKSLPKTKKRPQRPYGGVLCSSCMRKKIEGQVI